MLFDSYEQQGLFFNMNFKDKTSSGPQAYRGDLVLTEGEVADASGRRKPPTATVRQSVLLGSEDKLLLAAGFLDEVAKLGLFAERYGKDFAADIKLLFFVANIAKPLQVELAGANASLVPLEDGMVWNELLEVVHLDKDDLKGQSAADKVVTVLGAFKDYKPKGDAVTLDEALTRTVAVKLGGRGPV